MFGCSPCESKHDTLIVGISPDNPPYELVQNEQVIGFDVDLIYEIAKLLNKNVEIKIFDFNGLLAALSTNNVDLVISGLSKTPKREESFLFSQVYSKSDVAVLYRKSEDFSSLEDLTRKIIGVQLGTTWESFAVEMAEQFNWELISLNNNLPLVEELKSRAVDAVILERVQAKNFADKDLNLDFFVLDDFASSFSIAIAKNNQELLKEVNMAIEKLKAIGKIDEIANKWFN